MKNLYILFFFLSLETFAQNQYLLLFKDKANSPYAIARPKEFLSERAIQRRIKQNVAISERDFPPNPTYLAAIKQKGATVLYKSRWLNAALIETDNATLATILALPFVKGIEWKGDIRNTRIGNIEEGKTSRNKFDIETTKDNGLSQQQLAMLGADKMHQKGYRGEGMLIGVLDSGFSNANNLSFFTDLFKENRVIGTWDFVDKETNVYDDHSHGTSVLSCMGAFIDGQIVGTAYKASYVLYRTEDVKSETKREEANWLFAAEMADSVGVDVINTSLGYSTFDNAAQNYTYADLNGDRALATRAADWAAQAGILVVVSAGNDGDKSWKYISTPADADSVIAVGAVSVAQNPASFTSFGPASDGRIKPELAAQGLGTTIGYPSGVISNDSGTSFAAPLLAGFAASFWQAFPELTNMQVRDYLIRSASKYESPDTRVGYGIPNFDKAYELAMFDKVIKELKKTEQEVVVFPNPMTANDDLKVIILKENAGKIFTLSLIDNNGKLLWSNTSSSTFFTLPINKNELSNASYILKITSQNLNYTTKLVKYF